MSRLRYLICPLLLSGLLVGRPLLAQDSTRQFVRPALLKTNLAGPISLFLEVPTTARQSLQVSVHYLNMEFLFDRARLFNITPSYKFYLSKSVGSARRPAPKGLYLSPYLKYRWIESEMRESWWSPASGRVAYSMLGGGVVVGAQFINRWGLTLDGFLGGGYNPLTSYRIIQEYPPNPPPKPQLRDLRYDLRVGLCIGFAFARPGTR